MGQLDMAAGYPNEAAQVPSWARFHGRQVAFGLAPTGVLLVELTGRPAELRWAAERWRTAARTSLLTPVSEAEAAELLLSEFAERQVMARREVIALLEPLLRWLAQQLNELDAYASSGQNAVWGAARKACFWLEAAARCERVYHSAVAVREAMSVYLEAVVTEVTDHRGATRAGPAHLPARGAADVTEGAFTNASEVGDTALRLYRDIRATLVVTGPEPDRDAY